MKLSLGCFVLGVVAMTGCAAEQASEPTGAATANLDASDLAHDLALPAGELGTPFTKRDDMDLVPSIASDLKALLERCAETPVSTDPHGLETVYEMRSKCPELGAPTWNEKTWTERVDFRLGDEAFTALTFDGRDSDGGDESDLAIYDASGRRIAVYTALYGDNSAVGDMASVLGAHVPEVTVPFH
jgi:hypothetical protein